MNFQTISPVPNSKTLLDIAFRRAREKAEVKKFNGEWIQKIRQKENLKFEVIKETAVSRLNQVLEEFPHTEALPHFYQRLLELTVDYPEFKKSLGALNWAQRRINIFQQDCSRKMRRASGRRDISDISKQFYGRISSMLKQIDSNLKYLEQCRRMMRTYPDIKEMFTVCVYGFPNVGKSTLLNKLTGTRAEVAAYAFTTKSINAGYLNVEGKKIQVLDVPGILNRNKMNNIELQADLVLKELADVIVFVFDLSGYSGFTIEQQEELLRNLGRKEKVIIYLSKKDIMLPKIVAEFKQKHYSLEEVKEKIISMLKKKEESVEK